MFATIVCIVLFIVSIRKFYKNRALFKTLTAGEWVQYIASLVMGIGVVLVFILGGARYIRQVWDSQVLAAFVMIVGLYVGSYVMDKLLPHKVRAFYDE